MSSDDKGANNAPQTPAAALLFQAPEFTAPVFQEPQTPAPSDQSVEDGGERPKKNSRRKAHSGEDTNQSSTSKQGTRGTRGARPSNSESEDSGSRSSGSQGEAAQGGQTESATEQPSRGKGSRSRKASQRKSSGESEASESRTASDQGTADSGEVDSADSEGSSDQSSSGGSGDEGTATVRRRRRRSRSDAAESSGSDSDQVQSIKGSTRLEAKRMRRREGRKEGRRRHSITESEFLARRESVERQMVVRHEDGSDQVAVLEDGILVEHFVARKTNQSIVGNIYLGKVQNVLPSMEAAFVDVGRGRNAVLYAGEVNWDALGMQGKPRRIETALQAGDSVLVQVTKDPIGHKGARLTSQITLAGRYLVLVPGSSVLGISRKLPDNERNRLKKTLKLIVPETAGVIVRTAAEGATEEQLRDDVERLTKQWESIEKKVASNRKAPTLLRGEPELVVRVVRDLFNEDVSSLVVQGSETWDTVHEYVEELSPELLDRLEHWVSKEDVFDAKNVRSQLAKGMDRKVWLPSGGTLIIERTEALTVIDVNTGKFVGSGGTLEETVTRNNLEAAEEIVRQLRLRDIGGIVIIDFVDMVLEANRELVLRRLVESLGRDRTRHQVTEITSLGLVQMTRKRVGEGLVEAFSTTCEACEGRGFIVHDHPVETGQGGDTPRRRNAGGTQRQGREHQHQQQHKQEQPQRQETHVGDARVKSALSAIAAASASPASSEGSAAVSDEKPAVETVPGAPALKEGAAQESSSESSPSKGRSGGRGVSRGQRRAQNRASGNPEQELEALLSPKLAAKAAAKEETLQAQPKQTVTGRVGGRRRATMGSGGAVETAGVERPAAGAAKPADSSSETHRHKPASLSEIVLPTKETGSKEVAKRPRRRAVVTGPLDTGATGESAVSASNPPPAVPAVDGAPKQAASKDKDTEPKNSAPKGSGKASAKNPVKKKSGEKKAKERSEKQESARAAVQSLLDG